MNAWRLLTAVLALGQAGCSLIFDWSPLTDGGGGGDGTQPVIDGTVIDTPPPPIDAGPDRLEPNDSCAAPAAIDVGSYPDLSIFPKGDKDFFRFTLAAPKDVTIDLLFRQAYGDLDLYLRNDGCTVQLEASTGIMDNEQITMTQLPAASYVIEVNSFHDLSANSYTLNLTEQ